MFCFVVIDNVILCGGMIDREDEFFDFCFCFFYSGVCRFRCFYCFENVFEDEFVEFIGSV